MSTHDEFDSVRRDPEPVSRARRATDLLAIYSQRSTELARLRRAAVEEAHEAGVAYSDIAKAVGLSKGRITQIRASAPPPERALFGVGPITIIVPSRYSMTDRERPLLAAEDVAASDVAAHLLSDLGFTTSLQQIKPEDELLPGGDLFIICGPKSASAAALLIEQDPLLNIIDSDGHWSIIERTTGAMFQSPTDLYGDNSDIAYLSRRVESGRVITHVAGLHAIGSLGAVTHLQSSADVIYGSVGERSFSLIVASRYDGLAILETETRYGPQRWNS